MERLRNEGAVLQILEKMMSRRAFRAWRLEGLRYDAMTQSYFVVCSNGEVTVSVNLLDEWIRAALSDAPFARRPIKRAMKQALRVEDSDDPEN